MSRFGYVFVQPAGSSYPPILDLHTIDGDVVIEGAGGAITLTPFEVEHGRIDALGAITLTPFEVEHGRIDALGFRIGDLAYLPDVSDIPAPAWTVLQGLDCWVLDALRYTPHPTHAHLELALEWLERSGARRGVLTNMHIDLDHATVEAETPDHVRAAYDGMTIHYEL